MSHAAHSSPCHYLGQSYEGGPTACIASPEVMASIRRDVAERRILSAADARLATLAGIIDIPPITRTGFNDGVIYPPTLPPAGLAAAPAAAPTQLFSLRAPAGKLSLNCLVLLVDFVDNPGNTPPSHFQNLLFNPTDPGSMHSFYRELSYGRLSVSGQVTNWIRAAHPYSYYTAGQSGTGNSFPQNTPGLLQEVLAAYCTASSLAPFDVNGDGYVDGLFLVHAGPGAEAEPDTTKRANMIWSHKWVLPQPFTNNGVSAFAYFTAPEDGRLGVFSHEFGHFLGLPDLYDTSYRSRGVGDWCLMGGGSWNGGGNMPARMSAWCLAKLGWIKPNNVKVAGPLSLNPIEQDRNACYRLWTNGKSSKEYFLIENRQRAGRDAALPGSGLALWHIDETQSDNTNPLAYMVALVQADGKRQLELNKNDGDKGDLFPGSAKVTKVSDVGLAHPHTRSNSAAGTGVALSNIKEANGVVSLNVTVGTGPLIARAQPRRPYRQPGAVHASPA